MASKMFTYQELSRHKTKEDCWVAIQGKVYDVTKFLPKHPGGYDIVLCEAGGDATEAFNGVTRHADTALELLPDLLIGDLDPNTRPSPPPVEPPPSGHSPALYVIPLGLAAAYFIWRQYS